MWLTISTLALRHWKVLAIGGAVALVLLLTYCAGREDEQGKQAVRELKTERRVYKADGRASEQRLDDAVRAGEQKVELNNAILDATSPDDLRRRRGCAILRQQGRDVAALPACR